MKVRSPCSRHRHKGWRYEFEPDDDATLHPLDAQRLIRLEIDSALQQLAPTGS